MNVELAKTAGFCFGVKRAVDTVYKQIEKHQSEKIFTYGPIIHNEEVIKDLRSHGVEVLNDEEELKTVDADVVVIRSHGVAKYIYDIMDERGITCVDATCPFVKKIHKIVAEDRLRKMQKDLNCLKKNRKYVSWPRRHLTTINSKN